MGGEKVIIYSILQYYWSIFFNVFFSVIEEENKEETENSSAPAPVKKGIFGRWGSSSKAKIPGTPPNSQEPVRTPNVEPEQGKQFKLIKSQAKAKLTQRHVYLIALVWQTFWILIQHAPQRGVTMSFLTVGGGGSSKAKSPGTPPNSPEPEYSQIHSHMTSDF